MHDLSDADLLTYLLCPIESEPLIYYESLVHWQRRIEREEIVLNLRRIA